MRIALIGPAYPYKGGGAQHTTELARRLAAAGHDVVIESWRAQYPGFLYPGRQTVETPDGAPFPATRRELSWRRPDGWFRLGRRLRGCDVVVLTVLSPVQAPAYLGILGGLRGMRAARRTRSCDAAARRSAPEAVPQILALCHNVLPHERRSGDVPLTRALLRRADGALVHSVQQAELARGLAPDTPVQVADLPPHLPDGRDRIREDQAVRDTPGSRAADQVRVDRGSVAAHPAEPFRRILFFGIVRPYKGLDVLLRALARCPAEVSLTIAGEFWGGLDSTRALVAELNVGGRVEICPGYVPASEIPGLFRRVDALVLPYRSATASQNVWLAHSHQVPVIATRTGALAENVRDRVDGLLCEPDDVADLALALERFYAPGEPARLRAGVRPVDPGPYWDAYIDRLLALAERPSPGS